MDAKDKAKELYEKMYWHFRTKADSDICKQCALIAVDEIINNIPCREDYSSNGWVLIDNTEYWKEVIKEIEKL